MPAQTINIPLAKTVTATLKVTGRGGRGYHRHRKRKCDVVESDPPAAIAIAYGAPA